MKIESLYILLMRQLHLLSFCILAALAALLATGKAEGCVPLPAISVETKYAAGTAGRVFNERHLYIVFTPEKGEEKVIKGGYAILLTFPYVSTMFLVERNVNLESTYDRRDDEPRHPKSLYCGERAYYIWEIMNKYADAVKYSGLQYNLIGINEQSTSLNSNTFVQYILLETHDSIAGIDNKDLWDVKGAIYPEFHHRGLDGADRVYKDLVDEMCRSEVDKAVEAYKAKFPRD